MKLGQWHYGISLLLLVALVPVLRSQNLPIRFDWQTFGVAYWVILAAQAIFVATLLVLTGWPRSQVWTPFLARYRQAPLRILLLLTYFGLLIWATSLTKAVVLAVDSIAILELRDRQRTDGLRLPPSAVLVPAAYLFFGFLIVLAYNYAIVSARFNFATDPALGAIDRWLLHGYSVSDLAHWAARTFPLSFFHALEFIYFGMFPQIGATIILVALCDGRKRALQFVGTVLTSYYLALAIFYMWPAQGPYYLCSAHFSRFPASMQVYNIQKTLIPHALALWHHEPISQISTDYFIGFPCMHIVQPLIVLWFLRRWRRIVIALAAYDVLLVIAILLLEQHYVVDFLGGIVVSAAAIMLCGGSLYAGHKRAEGVSAPAVGSESAG